MVEHTSETCLPRNFDPLHDTADRQLLGSVTLLGNADPRLKDPAWLASMRHCINVGSQDMRQLETSSQAEEVRNARNQFAYEIGVGETGHLLHGAYKKPNQRPLPATLLETVATLDEITGNGLGAIHSTGGALAIVASQRIRQRFTIIKRLAHTLDWQGDAQQLLVEKPYLLRTNPVVWFILARLAAKHGTKSDTQLSVREVGKLLYHSPESHMLAAVSNEAYRFGDHIPLKAMAKIGIPAAKRQVHQGLTDHNTVERVGARTAQAYRRYRPEKTAPEQVPAKQYVTGTEKWLKPVLTSGQMSHTDLAAQLNGLIAAGGQSLLRYKRDSPQYTVIVEARVELLRALDLINPKSETYKEFETFIRNQPSAVNSETFITICQCLENHGIKDPLGAVQNCFKMLLSPKLLEAKLQAINDCGIDPETALQYHPKLLKESPERVKDILQTMRTAVRVRAKRKAQTMYWHTPKTPQDTKAPGETFNPLRFKQDFALLYLVTLNSGKLADNVWIGRIKSYVDKVPKKLHIHMTAKEIAHIKNMKQWFAQELGLDDPDHPLALAYAQKGAIGMVPSLMLDTLQALQELTGNALTAVMQDQQLLFLEARTLFRRFRYIEKIVSMLGWEGDPAELVRTYPAVLRASDQQKIMLAHLARQHGTLEDTQLDSSRIAAALIARPEAHLLELLNSPSYHFGNKVTAAELSKIGTSMARRRIHAAIATPEGAAALGSGVVKAYLRFNPLPKASCPAG